VFCESSAKDYVLRVNKAFNASALSGTSEDEKGAKFTKRTPQQEDERIATLFVRGAKFTSKALPTHASFAVLFVYNNHT
jgi:hypothetical protein